MRRFVTVLLALSVCLVASSSSAGRIFGDIKMDGKPVPAGVPVKIAVTPPAGAPGAEAKASIVADSTVTDKFGSYKLTVKEEGKCVVTVVYDKQAPTLDVFSYKEAVRYDLVLEKRNGNLTLKRK